MALRILYQVNERCSWALWHITEEEANLREILPISTVDEAYLHKISHPDKRKEFLAARICIKALLEKEGLTYQGLPKDKFDKPFLKHSAAHVSISHTLQVAVAILHKSAVGIDIEPIRPKLWRIAHKFLNPSEQVFVGKSLDKLTLIWAAKEALYKLYGKKKLSFKENMSVQTFQPEASGSFKIDLFLENAPPITYPAFYHKWGENFVVYVLDLEK